MERKKKREKKEEGKEKEKEEGRKKGLSHIYTQQIVWSHNPRIYSAA